MGFSSLGGSIHRLRWGMIHLLFLAAHTCDGRSPCSVHRERNVVGNLCATYCSMHSGPGADGTEGKDVRLIFTVWRPFYSSRCCLNLCSYYTEVFGLMTCRLSFLNNSSEVPVWVSPWDKRSPQCFSVRNTEFQKVISLRSCISILF